MKVRDLMTTDVVTVARETTLKEVAELFVERGISGVPVVEDGRVVGVVSERDFLFKEGSSVDSGRGFFARLMDGSETILKIGARTAGDAMSTPPVTIGPGRTVAEAARLMLDRAISRLPVVDDGRLVGIVAESDLVRAFARTDQEIRREIREDAILATLWESPDEFEIDVHDGHVAISGEVESREHARVIETMVARVPGVVDLEASLRIGGAA
jgi:CBS domain-containing protein